MFGSMGIKAKLFTTFMFVSFLNVVVGAVNYVQFQKVAKTYNHITTVNLHKGEAIAYMRV